MRISTLSTPYKVGIVDYFCTTSMIQFYRYIIYRLYSSALDKKSSSPIFDVIWALAFVHLSQVAAIYALLIGLNPGIPLFVENRAIVIVFCIFMLVSHYFLFYNKKRWEAIMEEFKDETPTEKTKGRWRVSLYLNGFPILCFIVILLVGLAKT